MAKNISKARMDRDEIDTFLQENNIDICGKRVLDVGMGRGYHIEYLYELGAEIYGFDIVDYFEFPKEIGNIYITAVEDMPKELYGTFDIVIQYRYHATPEAIKTIAKALKPSEKYIVTFVDLECGRVDDKGKISKPETEVAKTLFNCFENLDFEKPLFNSGYGEEVQCIASKPRLLNKSFETKKEDFKSKLSIENYQCQSKECQMQREKIQTQNDISNESEITIDD